MNEDNEKHSRLSSTVLWSQFDSYVRMHESLNLSDFVTRICYSHWNFWDVRGLIAFVWITSSVKDILISAALLAVGAFKQKQKSYQSRVVWISEWLILYSVTWIFYKAFLQAQSLAQTSQSHDQHDKVWHGVYFTYSPSYWHYLCCLNPHVAGVGVGAVFLLSNVCHPFHCTVITKHCLPSAPSLHNKLLHVAHVMWEGR